uniref:Uncharacterized protein n=1 Tax=candidate division CPR3 bacterium TaxID=2268181 RepID=A0A7V3N4P9_UNCC3
MRTIYTDHTILTQDRKYTFLSTDATAGATSISVQSIKGFESTAQILLIGELGNEKTEFAYPSHATAPSGSTIYLYGNLAFDHPQDTKVYVVDWDKIEVFHASTIAGAKSILGTITIQVDLKESLYKDTTQNSGYYFTRFFDSVNELTSDYSDPIPYTGYGDNTVFMIKKRALDSCNETIGDLITHEFLNEALWQARREYHKAPGKRPFRRKFGVDIGNVTTGMYRIAVPSDLEKPYTAENIYKVGIGTEKACEYYDKKEFDDDYEGVAHTTLDRAYTVGDQDLWCKDVRDFDDSGSVTIENDVIEYSAKGVSGGTLRISASGSYNHDAETDVWQNASFGLPDKFTVFVDSEGSACIYFNRPIETTYVNQNIWCDYYRTLVDYDSDADELDEPEYDMYIPYLAFRIKQRKNKGLQPLDDPDFILWTTRKNEALQKEYLGTEVKFKPDVRHLPLP